MDDRDLTTDPKSATETPNTEALPYYLPPGQPPLTEAEIAAGIAFSRLTGCPYFKRRPGEPTMTSEDVRALLEDFP